MASAARRSCTSSTARSISRSSTALEVAAGAERVGVVRQQVAGGPAAHAGEPPRGHFAAVLHELVTQANPALDLFLSFAIDHDAFVMAQVACRT